MEIRKPDHFLNVDTSSLGTAVGDIIRKSEEVLIKEKPDALLVLGDTNSCLSAYMARRLHIPPAGLAGQGKIREKPKIQYA